MRTIALIARGAVTYKGLNRSYAVADGEVFEAEPVDAAVLRYRNQVDFAPRLRASAGSPLPVAVRAETTEPVKVPVRRDRPADEPAEAEEEDTAPRRRRQYRRRDLTAED